MLYRTPSEKVCEIETYSLKNYVYATEKQRGSVNNQNSTPLLVVYTFINRHYNLDLLPEVSVIRSLLNHGLNIFATDWGTPSAYDKNLTIGHFVNKYMDRVLIL